MSARSGPPDKAAFPGCVLWWDLADDVPADGDYAISTELYLDEEEESEAPDQQVEELIRDLGRIADQRYCYIKATVLEPATGRTWSGVEPPKADRRRRQPRRRRSAPRRRRHSRPDDFLSFDRWGARLYPAGPAPMCPCVIRKGQAGDALYYLDDADRQSSWHPDIAKARRFASDEDAMNILSELLKGDLEPYIDGEDDLIEVNPAGPVRGES